MTIDHCAGQDCWVCHVLRHETQHDESPPAETGQVPLPRRSSG